MPWADWADSGPWAERADSGAERADSGAAQSRRIRVRGLKSVRTRSDHRIRNRRRTAHERTRRDRRIWNRRRAAHERTRRDRRVWRRRGAAYIRGRRVGNRRIDSSKTHTRAILGGTIGERWKRSSDVHSREHKKSLLKLHECLEDLG